MIAYIVRRLLYAVPIVLGVNIITFMLFFLVNTPDDIARHHVDWRRASLSDLEKWKREHGYHLPYFYHDGWQSEGVREFRESGWVELPGLPRGEGRLRVELPAGSGSIRLAIAANPADSISAAGWSPATVDEKPPEGATIVSATSMALGSARTEILAFSVRSEKGAELRLYAALPAGSSRVIVRLQRYEDPGLGRFTQTLFFQKSIKFLWLSFGHADDGRNILQEISHRIPPSLFVTLPMFLLGLIVEITIAMMLAYFRGTYLDFAGVVLCVIMMSVSIMFYVVGGQWMFGKTLHLAPISGYDRGTPLKFTILAVMLGVISGAGSGARWYRTIFLEEIGKDYIRTARMKGLPEGAVLYKHALMNAMIPILTSVVISIPFLFMGALILESFFAIPGMGSFTIEAIQRQDFAIVQAMVVLGSYLYIVGLILTDISYTLVDPRVRLQ